MAPGKFYAVRCGYIPGIYDTWAACQQQVRGYKGSQFKSFKSRLEAEQYLSSPGSPGQTATISNVSVLASPQSSVHKRPRSRSPSDTQPLSRNQVFSSFKTIEKKTSSFVICQPCIGAIFLSNVRKLTSGDWSQSTYFDEDSFCLSANQLKE
jgi:viroplasmin and RNaseH domain-containing protein